MSGPTSCAFIAPGGGNAPRLQITAGKNHHVLDVETGEVVATAVAETDPLSRVLVPDTGECTAFGAASAQAVPFVDTASTAFERSGSPTTIMVPARWPPAAAVRAH